MTRHTLNDVQNTETQKFDHDQKLNITTNERLLHHTGPTQIQTAEQNHQEFSTTYLGILCQWNHTNLTHKLEIFPTT
jgi:hypothetical protein